MNGVIVTIPLTVGLLTHRPRIYKWHEAQSIYGVSDTLVQTSMINYRHRPRETGIDVVDGCAAERTYALIGTFTPP